MGLQIALGGILLIYFYVPLGTTTILYNGSPRIVVFRSFYRRCLFYDCVCVYTLRNLAGLLSLAKEQRSYAMSYTYASKIMFVF